MPQYRSMDDTAYEKLKGVDGAAFAAVLRGYYTTASATIMSGQSVSTVVSNPGYKYFTIIMPGAWDAANLAFQGSVDNTNYYDVYMDGSMVVELAAASRVIVLNVNALALTSLPYIRIKSVSTSNPATPVNQTANRTLTIVMSY